MKNEFTRAISTPVPQTAKADVRQVKNNAGGFVFEVTDQTRLERFLILGTSGGTYYQNEQDFTKENLEFLIEMIQRDPAQVVSVATTISHEGRAYKNGPAIFTLALVFKYGSDEGKAMAKAALPKICRTSTHLFEFASYIEALGGWSRAKRSAISNWYNEKTTDELAYQVVKYRQRNGWTHRDLFRLAHPKGVDQNVGNFILGKETLGQNIPPIIAGFKFAQEAKTPKGVLGVLGTYKNLPWEALPTEVLKSPEVWKELFYNGQLKGQALVRNITRLARIEAFNDMVFARDYANRLVDEEMIRKTRLHPLNFLNAIVVHQEGQVDRNSYSSYSMSRKKNWETVPVIVDALNEGFYKSFKYVEPAGKRTFIAIDVSGSMSAAAAGLDLSCAQVAGAMAMTVAKTEPYYMVRGFTSAGWGYSTRRANAEHDPSGLTDLGITPRMELNSVMKNVQRNNFGSTDCSLPMEFAIQKKLEIDTFVVFTDNETYAGKRHPFVALKDYRKKSGINARLVVAALTSSKFSIADPSDAGMLDVVGADANLPRMIADFSAGRV